MTILRRTLESTVERRVVTNAARDGLRSLKLNLRYDSGWPDRIWLIPGGRPLFSEFKRPGEEPTPLQAERLRFLAALGYDTAVFTDYDEAMRKTPRMTVADLNHVGVGNADDPNHPFRLDYRECFHCGQTLDRIFVCSEGGKNFTIAIGLHPKCAVLLGQIFIKDGIIGDMISRGVNPSTSGVVPSLRPRVIV